MLTAALWLTSLPGRFIELVADDADRAVEAIRGIAGIEDVQMFGVERWELWGMGLRCRIKVLPHERDNVRREFLKDARPASTGVIVAGLLREGALIEISAVAVLRG